MRSRPINPAIPLALLCLIVLFSGCSRPPQSRTGFALATLCTITLYDSHRPQVFQEIFRRLGEIENLMSPHISESDVDRINKASGKNPVKVHPDVFYIVEQALRYAELSEGAFDPAVGPLTSLWGIGFDNQQVPSQEEIDRVLPLINWKDIELDYENSTVFLKRPGMALDLGAIAKGYAADEVSAIIKKAGIPRAIIDLGGNILLVGEKKDKTPWKVGIQDPAESRGSYIGTVQVKDDSVVTSGVYERFFTSGGTTYHHLFSPQNGYPARNDLLSVTIITGVSAAADALSTAVFVMGYEKGRALAESMDGVEAIFVFQDQSIRLTGGVDFRPIDDSYRVVDTFSFLR